MASDGHTRGLARAIVQQHSCPTSKPSGRRVLNIKTNEPPCHVRAVPLDAVPSTIRAPLPVAQLQSPAVVAARANGAVN
jgi:hypothetical protein